MWHPQVGKLVYCTRTVPEMEKVLGELQELIHYRARYFPPGEDPKLLALGLSSRKNLCINPAVAGALPSHTCSLFSGLQLCAGRDHASPLQYVLACFHCTSRRSAGAVFTESFMRDKTISGPTSTCWLQARGPGSRSTRGAAI